jgi:di/tricarboxylate transporter
VVVIRGELDLLDLETLKLESIPPSPTTTLVDTRYPLVELIITPHSSLLGKTLREINFRVRYGLTVLGIWRQGNPILEQISTIGLQPGDALLVQGAANFVHQIQGESDLILLEEDPDLVPQPKKLALAIGITITTLTLAALDVFPVPLVVLAGAVLLLLTGCMKMNDAIHRIEWKAIFLIAGMWPLTIAIRESGLAANLTEGLLSWLGPIPPLAVAAVFLFLSMLFTQFLSGPVTPIIIIPLALSAAKNYGIDPQPLALAVALGCSLAFITPFSHPVNVMVMNPGGYRFKDFFRVGLPLTVLAFLTILAGLHFIWGL